MKTLILTIVVLFSVSFNLCAQSDSLSSKGFTVGLNATMGTENRYGVAVGYEFKEISVYAEVSMGSYKINNVSYDTPSIRIGAEYSFLKFKKAYFFAGAFAGYTKFQGSKFQLKNAYINSVGADALSVGLRLGVKANIGKHFFVKAAAEVSSYDFDRVMGITKSTGAYGKYDAGLNVGVGYRF